MYYKQLARNSIILCYLMGPFHLSLCMEVSSKELFFKAVKNGNLEDVKKYLKFADANAREKNGKTPLELAAGAGKNSAKIIEILIKAGAQINAVTTAFEREGLTPLYTAVTQDNVEAIHKLIEQGATIDARSGITCDAPLHAAACYGRLQAAEVLVQMYRAPVNARDKSSWTPLHDAASYGQLEILQLLIKTGAEVDARTNTYETALHLAAKKGHFQIVKALVQAQANVNAHDQYNETALHKASFGNHLDTVKALLEAGAKPNATRRDGCTPVALAQSDEMREILKKAAARDTHDVQQAPKKLVEALNEFITAAQGKDTPTVGKLRDKGSDINARDEKGDTALHVAVAKDRVDTAKLLIALQIDVDIQNKNGDTALHCAAHKGYSREMVKVLIEAGASVDLRNIHGCIPLHQASLSGNYDAVLQLIQAHSPVDVVQEGYYTPLHYAAMNGYVKIVKELIDTGGALVPTPADRNPLGLAVQSTCDHSVDVVDLLAQAGANISLKELRSIFTELSKSYEKNRVLKNIECLLSYGINLEGVEISEELGQCFDNDLVRAFVLHSETAKTLIKSLQDEKDLTDSEIERMLILAAGQEFTITKKKILIEYILPKFSPLISSKMLMKVLPHAITAGYVATFRALYRELKTKMEKAVQNSNQPETIKNKLLKETLAQINEKLLLISVTHGREAIIREISQDCLSTFNPEDLYIESLIELGRIIQRLKQITSAPYRSHEHHMHYMHIQTLFLNYIRARQAIAVLYRSGIGKLPIEMIHHIAEYTANQRNVGRQPLNKKEEAQLKIPSIQEHKNTHPQISHSSSTGATASEQNTAFLLEVVQSEDDDPELIKELISQGVKITIADKDGWTPLHFAVSKGKLGTVKVLLDAGADASYLTNHGERPADLTKTAAIKSLLP